MTSQRSHHDDVSDDDLIVDNNKFNVIGAKLHDLPTPKSAALVPHFNDSGSDSFNGFNHMLGPSDANTSSSNSTNRLAVAGAVGDNANHSSELFAGVATHQHQPQHKSPLLPVESILQAPPGVDAAKYQALLAQHAQQLQKQMLQAASAAASGAGAASASSSTASAPNLGSGGSDADHSSGSNGKVDKEDEKPDFCNLLVNYIPNQLAANTELLSQLFEAYGEVVSCKIVKNTATGESKGFGFVRMATPQQAAAAKSALDSYKIYNKKLRVSLAMGGGHGGGSRWVPWNELPPSVRNTIEANGASSSAAASAGVVPGVAHPGFAPMASPYPVQFIQHHPGAGAFLPHGAAPAGFVPAFAAAGPVPVAGMYHTMSYPAPHNLVPVYRAPPPQQQQQAAPQGFAPAPFGVAGPAPVMAYYVQQMPDGTTRAVAAPPQGMPRPQQQQQPMPMHMQPQRFLPQQLPPQMQMPQQQQRQ